MILERFQAGYESGAMVVKGIDMEFPAGSVTAVLGPNGSGKSTLLKGVMGFPGLSCSGTVKYHGESLAGMERRKRARLVGYLPQDPPVPSGLTGLETVLLGRHPHRSAWAGDSPADVEAAWRALEMVEAGHLAERPVDHISGGEYRLINLAAVLVQQTPVILLDEPGSSLDYGNACHLWQILSQLARSGKTVVATTHRIGMATGHFHRVLLLAGGEQVKSGDPGTVFNDSALLSKVYGTPLRAVRNTPGGWIVIPGGGGS